MGVAQIVLIAGILILAIIILMMLIKPGTKKKEKPKGGGLFGMLWADLKKVSWSLIPLLFVIIAIASIRSCNCHEQTVAMMKSQQAACSPRAHQAVVPSLYGR